MPSEPTMPASSLRTELIKWLVAALLAALLAGVGACCSSSAGILYVADLGGIAFFGMLVLVIYRALFSPKHQPDDASIRA